MLRLIPKPLHILALRSAHAVRLRWWRLRKTRVSGCRVLVLDEQERVLLIRHSYGSPHWMLPGGGMKRGEDPLVCAAREVWEECAVRIERAVEISVVTDMMHGSNNDVRVVAGLTTDAPRADGREIAEVRFFALDDLPHDLAGKLPSQIPAYVTAAKAAHRGD